MIRSLRRGLVRGFLRQKQLVSREKTRWAGLRARSGEEAFRGQWCDALVIR